MQEYTAPQPRIFVVGYLRNFRLELAEFLGDQGYSISFFEDARLAAHSLGFEYPVAVLLNWPQRGPLGCLDFTTSSRTL